MNTDYLMRKKNFHKVLFSKKPYKKTFYWKSSFIEQILPFTFYLYLAIFKCIQYIKKIIDHAEFLFSENSNLGGLNLKTWLYRCYIILNKSPRFLSNQTQLYKVWKNLLEILKAYCCLTNAILPYPHLDIRGYIL